MDEALLRALRAQLGTEAVATGGAISARYHADWSGYEKNNAGYDLKQLFIGTEGTLGIITRAVLRLQPAPCERHTAMVAVAAFSDLVALLAECRRLYGGQLSSFEVMWSDYYEFAVGHVLSGARPFAQAHALYALIELESFEPGKDNGRLEAGLAALLERGIIEDGVVTQSLDESLRLWRVRDAAGELIGHVPHALKPLVGALPPLLFGHLGDGNIHVLIGPREPSMTGQINDIVYGALQGFGSVAAEHGIGTLKRGYLGHSRSEAEVALMRTLKATLDPKRILNPGRVI